MNTLTASLASESEEETERSIMKLEELSRRLTVVEVQLEERWKETILRIKRIEAILIGVAGTIIVLLANIVWRM